MRLQKRDKIIEVKRLLANVGVRDLLLYKVNEHILVNVYMRAESSAITDIEKLIPLRKDMINEIVRIIHANQKLITGVKFGKLTNFHDLDELELVRGARGIEMMPELRTEFTIDCEYYHIKS